MVGCEDTPTLTSSGATSEGPGDTWYRSSTGGADMRELALSAMMAPEPSGARAVAMACLWAPESASLREGVAQAAVPREKRTVQAYRKISAGHGLASLSFTNRTSRELLEIIIPAE